MGLLLVNFRKFSVRVTALDYRQNFVSAQYLENKLMELDKILHMHCPCPDLRWDCYASIFTNLQHSYCLWLLSKVRFRSISWDHMLDVDQARFGLLCVNLSKFTIQLWPMVIVEISLLPSILPVKEITLHVKPAPTMYVMRGLGWGGGGGGEGGERGI